MNKVRGKNRKRQRLQAVTPPGLPDRFGNDIHRREAMLLQIAAIFDRYGFEPLETPAIEYLESLGKFLPDKDRPNEGVFAWQEDDSWLALRYDLTAPLARVAAQYRNTLPNPYRRYAIGPVWRDEKPGPGRFRQFIQCDADTVGSTSVAADAEMCLLATEILETLGIGKSGYRIRLNNRKILDGVLHTIGIDISDAGSAGADQRGRVMRAIDKLDRLGLDSVIALLGEGRRDESGDYTSGAGLSTGQIDIIKAFLQLEMRSGSSMFDDLRHLVGDSDAGSAGIYELEQLLGYLVAAGMRGCPEYPDTSLVRGLGYYTGNVMEAELTGAGDAGSALQRLGSVAGGGRYDGLVRRFTGHDVPATGISIGVERLIVALGEREDRLPDPEGPVLVTIMDRQFMAGYQRMVAELRAAGIRAEPYLGNARNFGKQLKYADQRNCPIAVIEGENERSRGIVLLKDLQLGREISRSASHEEWKAREWQVETRRDDLVDEVRNMLTRKP